MRKWKFGASFALILTVALTAPAGVRWIRQRLLLARLATVRAAANQPFTIRQRTTITGPHAGPDPVDVEHRVTATRSDGAHVDQIEDLKKGWVTRRIQLPTGVVATVYDEIKVVSTIQETPTQVAGRLGMALDPSAGCTAQRNGLATLDRRRVLGYEDILGISAAKIVDDSGMLTWRAPELGCAEVKLLVDWGNGAGLIESRLKSRLASPIRAGLPYHPTIGKPRPRRLSPSTCVLVRCLNRKSRKFLLTGLMPTSSTLSIDRPRATKVRMYVWRSPTGSIASKLRLTESPCATKP